MLRKSPRLRKADLHPEPHRGRDEQVLAQPVARATRIHEPTGHGAPPAIPEEKTGRAA